MKKLREAATSDALKSARNALMIDGIDTAALEVALGDMDIEDVKRRKRLLNRVYHECLLVESAQGGVSFTAMLLILAQHRLIDPNISLP